MQCRSWTTIAASLIAVCALAAGITAQSVRPASGTAAVVAAITRDRAASEQWLRSDPTSYLAAVDRRDFGTSRTLSVGRAADNDVRLDDQAVASHHLRVTVQGDAFQVSGVDPQARFEVDGQARASATLGPSTLGLGRFKLRLSHQGFPALIVFDPASPHFKRYKGLKYFPVDLTYRYELALTRDQRPETVLVQSTQGNERPARRVGWFEFKVAGTAVRVEAVRLLEPGVGENDISVFFRDATTGHESYAVGRYVDVKPLPNGRYLLDFNLAYNPACAFSNYYNCPIPSKANTLKVAIRAGEMDSHYNE
jgi:uncharacterized protein (DUF1684 family)